VEYTAIDANDDEVELSLDGITYASAVQVPFGNFNLYYDLLLAVSPVRTSAIITDIVDGYSPYTSEVRDIHLPRYQDVDVTYNVGDHINEDMTGLAWATDGHVKGGRRSLHSGDGFGWVLSSDIANVKFNLFANQHTPTSSYGTLEASLQFSVTVNDVDVGTVTVVLISYGVGIFHGWTTTLAISASAGDTVKIQNFADDDTANFVGGTIPTQSNYWGLDCMDVTLA